MSRYNLRLGIRALAAAFAISLGTATAQAPLPEIRHDGGVAYISGGATAAGRAETIRLGRDMNVQLSFSTTPGGVGLSDVAVAIVDSSGATVLDLASADTLLFAQLEPGRYDVSATVHGRSLSRSVEVPADGRRVERFEWRDDVALRVPEPLDGRAPAAAR